MLLWTCVCVCVKRDCRGEMTVRRSVVRRSVSVCSMSQHCSHMHGLVLLRSSSARTVKFRQVTTHHCTVALISWVHLTCWSGKYNSVLLWSSISIYYTCQLHQWKTKTQISPSVNLFICTKIFIPSECYTLQPKIKHFTADPWNRPYLFCQLRWRLCNYLFLLIANDLHILHNRPMSSDPCNLGTGWDGRLCMKLSFLPLTGSCASSTSTGMKNGNVEGMTLEKYRPSIQKESP